MDSFTLNKIAGAVLGTCLIGMGIGIVADEIYQPEKPKKPGYALPAGKPEEAGGEKGGSQLAALLAKGDSKKGEAAAKVCAGCHNFEEGAGTKVGPDLYGVVDREKGSVKGFEYSAGLKKKGGKWTFEDLDQFIKKPSAYVQGTKMGFGGEENAEKRADIIVFLRSLSKKPVELPKVAAGGKKGGGEKQAGGGGEDQLIKLIGSSDPKKGESDAQICAACHNFKKGEGNKVGPDLYGVVDREKGSVKGFDYSPGMKKKGGKWTYADLDKFLTKPSAYVQGTKMGFGGESSDKKRASIIAYLRSNADKPAPLPKPSGGGGKQESAKSDGGDKAGGGGGGDAFAKLVASADPKKGESSAQICAACHNFKKGEGNKVGPDLYGVVDRDKGSVQGFSYSPGMKKKGGKWTYDDLNQFLTKPSAYIQGTKMGFGGEADEKKRAAIVAYLRSNADKPAPLPGAGGDEKKAEGGDKKAAGEGKKAEGAKPAEGSDKKADAGKDAGGGDQFVKLVAAADAKKGESDAQICSACHSLKKGGGNLVGPELWGVVDREKGTFKGYSYSPGLKAKGGKWTYDDLNQFLTKPAAFVKGTKMGYPGEANEKKRASIVAYLRTLSDNPAPLPGAGGEKKTEAAPETPAKSEKAEAPKPDAKDAKKSEAAAKPDKAPPAEKKSEAAPAAQPSQDAASRGPEPYKGADPIAAPEVPKPTAAPAAEAPSGGESTEASRAPEPYKGADPISPPETPQPVVAPSGDTPAGGAETTEAGGPPAPYKGADPIAAAEPSEQRSVSAGPDTSSGADKASGGGTEPYKAPTPDEAK